MSTKTFAEGMKDGRNNEKMLSSDPDYIKGYEAGKKEYFKDQHKEEELRSKRRQNGSMPNKLKIAFGFDGIKINKEEDPTGNGGFEITPSQSFATVRRIILIIVLIVFVSSFLIFILNFASMRSMLGR